LVLHCSWSKISVTDTFVSVFSWWVEIKIKYFICNNVRNISIDGLRSIKHLYQFQKSQEVIGKIHILTVLTVFRDFQTTFIQNIEGQQTIYPNNNFLTSFLDSAGWKTKKTQWTHSHSNFYIFVLQVSVEWDFFLEAQVVGHLLRNTCVYEWKFCSILIRLGKSHQVVTVKIMLKFYKNHEQLLSSGSKNQAALIHSFKIIGFIEF
jgi:hypothetical protein